jgi:murein DD-endopeptidase MepM/ murein hydrolase activator NlpD
MGHASAIGKGRGLVLGLLLAAASSACVGPLRAQHGLYVRPYTVQKGDTLVAIARRFSTSVGQLASINRLGAPRRLQIGQQLRLPAPRVAAAPKRRPARSTGGPLWGKGSVTPAASPQQEVAPLAALRQQEHGLKWPVRGVITSPFGRRRGNAHDGIDIGAPRGSPVLAAAAGQVMFAKRHGDYGNLVILKHPGGVVTVYAHHERNCVAEGDTVQGGQTIARVGATGNATGPHLHFEVRQHTQPQDPLAYLPRPSAPPPPSPQLRPSQRTLSAGRDSKAIRAGRTG